jgi:hypothetical protein
MTQEELLEIKKQRKIEADELLLKKIAEDDSDFLISFKRELEDFLRNNEPHFYVRRYHYLKAKDISKLIQLEYPELKFRVADYCDFKGIWYEFTPKKKHKILFWEVWL